MTIQFSVIIPVFNAERTLRRCLDSLLTQDCSSAEILLIDDGSTDSSSEICVDYAAKYSNIRLFSQENRGVSSARNLGLSQARGKYILFVDSDDYVDAQYFDTLHSALADRAPELLLFSHFTVGRRTYQISIPNKDVEGAEETADTIACAIQDQSFNTLWSKAYLREIIERYQIRFNPALCIDEDITFSFSYAVHVSTIKTISQPLYYFCVNNPDSLSRKNREYLQDQLQLASIERLTVLLNSGLSPDNRRILSDALAWLHYRRVYSIATELLKSKPPRVLFRKKLRTACTAFEKEGIKPHSLSGRLIRLPVKLRLTGLIRLSAYAATMNRKRRLDY